MSITFALALTASIYLLRCASGGNNQVELMTEESSTESRYGNCILCATLRKFRFSIGATWLSFNSGYCYIEVSSRKLT